MSDQPITGNRLTIADVARALHPRMDRSLVQRYDGNAELRALLGKEDGTYPVSALLYWQAIADAREQNPPLVKPATAGLFLRSLLENEEGQSVTDDRLPIIGQAGSGSLVPLSRDMGQEALTLLQRLVEATEERSQAAPPEDRLIDAEEAAELLCCAPGSVRRYVRPVKRGRWRRSDVLRYIQALGREG